ncbi:vacuolar protein sorting-associated protein 13a [Schizosaccharomyces cryophilus OY26]|uniref:Vacuolar protein sorting-associated protein 13a n=1 Tax=Schizosaccharomyces cryophilus (strain OY26 / ATCC MYA-4695 / CBS 11777 / NBRC 106824 / NRRL Y48691) TaxID=653667 RepID=S9W700_SCHCR|nr:vacuolar protein sorting-associated protein 13a [Schizosaccharomyces cryophilus OY26]EPY53660.1 vacuolar protein sorting-associated protein 13a [Schizosaccharomyces cryophilus OY26]
MLEGLIAGLLNKVLGSYVDNLDTKQLNIGVWGGHVSLRNLSIKPEALDKLGIPIKISRGFIGTFNLDIPWSNIQKQSLKVNIEDIYLLIHPQGKTSLTEQQLEESRQNFKQEQLDSFEILRKNFREALDDVNSTTTNSKKQSLLEYMIAKLTANLEISIERIHLHYDDDLSDSNRPFSLGITLRSLRLNSTSEDYKGYLLPSDPIPDKCIHKHFVIGYVSIYYLEKCMISRTSPPEEIFAKLRASIPDSRQFSNFDYILKPMTVTGHLIFFRHPVDQIMQLRGSLSIEELSFALSNVEFNSLLGIIDYFKLMLRQQLYVHFRPAVNPKDDPLAWFRYSALVVKDSIHQKQKQWAWRYFKSRRDDRILYMDIIRRRYLNEQVAPHEIDLQKAIEQRTNIYDLIKYRSRVHTSLLNENNPAYLKLKKSAIQGWFDWAAAHIRKPPDHVNDNPKFTEEEQKQFFSAIEWSGQVYPNTVSLNPDTCMAVLNIFIERGSFSILSKKENKIVPIIEQQFKGFETECLIRPRSFKLKVSLKDLDIVDGITNPHLPPSKVVFCKHSDENSESNQKIPKSYREHLFFLLFDSNSLDSKASSVLLIHLRTLIIIYNRICAEKLIEFFLPTRTRLEHVTEWSYSAAAKVMNLARQTRASLDYALEQHKTADMTIDLQAPLIVVREVCSDLNSPTLFLDVGRIVVHTQLVDDQIIEKFRCLQSKQINSELMEQLKNLMYDRFVMSLFETRCLIAPNYDTGMSSLQVDSQYHILKECSLDISFEISILQKATNLTKFRVFSHMKSAEIMFTDDQYKVFINMMSKLLPDFPTIEIPFTTQQFLDAVKPPEFFDASENFQPSAEDYSYKFGSTKIAEFIAQEVFAFYFTVDNVVCSMFWRLNDKVIPIMRAFNTFSVELIVRKFDYHVLITLTDLTIKEFTYPSGLCNNTLMAPSSSSSEDPTGRVVISYTSIDEDSPELQTVYEGVRVTTGVVISDFNLNIAPAGFILIYDYVLCTFTPLNDVYKLREGVEIAAANDEGSQSNEKTSIKENANLRLQRVNIFLYDRELNFSILYLENLRLHMEFRETFSLQAHLYKGELLDCLSNSSNPKTILSIDDEALFNLQYDSYNISKPILKGQLQHDSCLELSVGPVTLNFNEEYFNALYGFFIKYKKQKGLYDSIRYATYYKLHREDISQTYTKFEFHVRNPTVVYDGIVTPNKQNKLTLFVNMGSFSIHNGAPKVNNKLKKCPFTVELNAINFSTSSSNIERRMQLSKTSNFNLSLNYATDLKSLSSILKIDAKSNELELNLCEPHHVLLWTLYNSVVGFTNLNNAYYSDKQLRNELVATLSRNGITSELTILDMSSYEFSIVVIYNFTKLRYNVFTDELFEDLMDLTTLHTVIDFSHIQAEQYMYANGRSYTEFSISEIQLYDVSRRAHPTLSKAFQYPEKHHTLVIGSFDCDADLPRYNLIIEVDSPTVYVNFDYLYPLWSVFVHWHRAYYDTINFANNRALKNKETSSHTEDYALFYRITFVELSLLFIKDIEAPLPYILPVYFGELLITQQSIMAVTANNVILNAHALNDTSRVATQLVDPFGFRFAYSLHTASNMQVMSNISLDFDALIVRATYLDLLFLQKVLCDVYNFYDALYKVPIKEGERLNEDVADNQFFTGIPNTNSCSLFGIKICKEECSLTIDGIRILLISRLHDLPIINLNVKPLKIDLNDWSSELNLNTHLELFMNFYNFANSHWEPFLEPWALGLHLSRNPNTLKSAVYLISRKKLELVITSQLLETLNFGFSKVVNEELRASSETDAPYRIHNYTGYTVSIWADYEGSDNSCVRRLEDGKETDWKFEEWRQMQDIMKQDGNRSCIGLHFENGIWGTLRRIRVNKVGEYIFPLMSENSSLKHYIVVDVSLSGEFVKHITLRSPLLLKNESMMEVEFILCDSNGHKKSPIYTIPPKEVCNLPIEAAYDGLIHIRPFSEFGYAWSLEPINWRNFAEKKQSILSCSQLQQADKVPFCRFAASAVYRNKQIASHYPYMHISITALLELKNLLPIDLRVRIVDKEANSTWMSKIDVGKCSYVHSVDISHVLLLQVQASNSEHASSSYATIVTNNPEVYERDKYLTVTLEDGRKVRLGLKYIEIFPRIFHIEIFSPYVVINKTRTALAIGPKSEYKKFAFSAVNLSHGTNDNAIPCLFSYWKNYGSRRCRLRSSNSQWSEPISFDAIGSVFEVDLPHKSLHDLVYKVGVFIETGPNGYSNTKIVTITSRFIIVNKTRWTLSITEPNEEATMEIEPHGEEFLKYITKTTSPMIQVCCVNFSEWSSPFMIEEIGSIYLRLPTPEGEKLIRAEITLDMATIFIYFLEENGSWPFYIRNETNLDFQFSQVNVIDEENKKRSQLLGQRTHDLPSQSEVKYSWDYPSSLSKEIVLYSGSNKCLTTLAEIGSLTPFKIKNEGGEYTFVSRDIIASGISKILILKTADPASMIAKPKFSSKVACEEQDFNLEQEDNSIDLSVKFIMEGIGVSLVCKNTQELAYITFHGVNFFYTDSSALRTFKLDIRWIQADNQLYGGIYPILLYPTILSQEDAMNDNSFLPTFHSMVALMKNDTYGVTYVKYATILLQELTIEIDEDFAFAAFEFMKDSMPQSWKPSEEIMFNLGLHMRAPSDLSSDLKVYFEVLNLQPTQLHLSFVRTERINNANTTSVSSHNPFVFFVNLLSMAIGNINDAPVRLNALLMDNAHVSLRRLFELVKNHYEQEMLFQVHKIVGSADFLGNPVGLFTTITSGFADIFYEPFHGFIINEGSYELGIGFAKGTASFVKKTIFGLTDSMSRVTGTISRSLSVITMDQKFQTRRRTARIRNRPVHILYGVTAGASSFYAGIRSGVSGLALQPVLGARRNGMPGFMKGLGKGVVGFTTKPLVGLFDFASSITEGARNTTTVFDERNIEKIRMSRLVHEDGVVHPFDLREALGQYWLKHLDNGRYFNEYYRAHIVIKSQLIVILTNRRIMFVRSKSLRCTKVFLLRKVQNVELRNDRKIALLLKKGTWYEFLVPQNTAREYIYRKIRDELNSLQHITAYELELL